VRAFDASARRSLLSLPHSLPALPVVVVAVSPRLLSVLVLAQLCPPRCRRSPVSSLLPACVSRQRAGWHFVATHVLAPRMSAHALPLGVRLCTAHAQSLTCGALLLRIPASRHAGPQRLLPNPKSSWPWLVAAVACMRIGGRQHGRARWQLAASRLGGPNHMCRAPSLSQAAARLRAFLRCSDACSLRKGRTRARGRARREYASPLSRGGEGVLS
jgi:hypothetical protein